MREVVTSKVEEAAQRVTLAEGLELVEVEVKGEGNSRLVRISIDKPEGVTHSDCQLVSDRVAEILEAEDAIPGHYTLEVSSPGVERKLLKPQDYQRFLGKKAKITVREAIDGQYTFEGTLAGFADGVISLETQPGVPRQLRFDQVKKANLKFEW
jgi:ribosome maturation factor RimP